MPYRKQLRLLVKGLGAAVSSFQVVLVTDSLRPRAYPWPSLLIFIIIPRIIFSSNQELQVTTPRSAIACKTPRYTHNHPPSSEFTVTKPDTPSKGDTFISKAALERKPRRILRNTVFNTATKPVAALPPIMPLGPSMAQLNANAHTQLHAKIEAKLQTADEQPRQYEVARGEPEMLTSGVLAQLCLDDFPLAEIQADVDYPYQAPAGLERIVNDVMLRFIRTFLGAEFSQVVALNMEDCPAYAPDMEASHDLAIPPKRIGLRVEFICMLNTPREEQGVQDSVERDKFEKFISFNLVYDEQGRIHEVHLPLELSARDPQELLSPAGLASQVEQASVWLNQNSAGAVPLGVTVLPCLSSGLVRTEPVPAVLSQMSGQRQGVALLTRNDRTMSGLSSKDAVYLYCGLVAFKSPYWLLPFHLIRQRPEGALDASQDITGLVELGNNRLNKSQATIVLDALRSLWPDLLENRGLVRLPSHNSSSSPAYFPLEVFTPELALSMDEILNSTSALKDCDALELTSCGLVRYLSVLEQFLFDELAEELNS